MFEVDSNGNNKNTIWEKKSGVKKDAIIWEPMFLEALHIIITKLSSQVQHYWKLNIQLTQSQIFTIIIPSVYRSWASKNWVRSPQLGLGPKA